ADRLRGVYARGGRKNRSSRGEGREVRPTKSISEANEFWSIAGSSLTIAANPALGPLVGEGEPAPLVLFVVLKSSESCWRSSNSRCAGCGRTGDCEVAISPPIAVSPITPSAATIMPASAGAENAAKAVQAHAATHKVRSSDAQRPI